MIAEQRVRIERLASQDRSGFECGEPALGAYLRMQATQDMRRQFSTCYVAVGEGPVLGFYTISPSSIASADLPPEVGKRLPKYPLVPVYRVGRLAVHRDAQGTKLGSALLADAIGRASRAEVAGYAVVVDAKNEGAVSFYRHHGFLQLVDRPFTLFLPLSRATEALT